MFESPPTLQQVCIDYICGNLISVCSLVPGAKLTFNDPHASLPTEISDMLLYNLCEKDVLSDLTISLFNSKSTRLKHVKLKKAPDITWHGLKVLQQHKVVDLELVGFSILLKDLLTCLGEWSLQNLRSLNISNSNINDKPEPALMNIIQTNFQKLQTLNLANSKINYTLLSNIISMLPSLESLDISNTKFDISSIDKCKDHLKFLYMCDFYEISKREKTFFSDFRDLRHLDISIEICTMNVDNDLTCILDNPDCLPYLVSLDISGRPYLDADKLSNFVDLHPNLQFLGLVNVNACYEERFTNPLHQNYNPELAISGMASEAQILEALRRYPSRPLYMQKCFYNLFRLTRNFNQVRVDIIKLVIPGMDAHPNAPQVQTAATACLYKLTKNELASSIHLSILKRIVELTLTAMENYPKNFQLQKNTLLTLCSDRILQDVSFDKYRCIRLVMNSLSGFEDSFMNRMSVAICSILAARISTIETSMIGATPKYMIKLLHMVRHKVISKSVDITMKFTLSALWNLTDESATTCKVFLQNEGFTLFLEVLECFKGESSIEAKVLGLLNNIAEVNVLRTRLMQERFLEMLSVLLDSEFIDVSYFAAGVAAHLLSDSSLWITETSLVAMRNRLLEQLEHAVTNWDTPQREMVAYRSFKPFFPLLLCEDAYPVQLWAIWAMHHVCTKNPKQYCKLLVQRQGVKVLYQLQNKLPETHHYVHKLCESILNTIEKYPCK